MSVDLEQRLAANFDAIMGEVLAPRRSRVERLLLRLHVPERWARVAAATPALRWSWLVAVFVVLLAAASAGDSASRSPRDLAVLLALAPVIPVAAVALAYGPHTDRAFEVHLVTPMSGPRLLLVRTVTVVVAAAGITLLAALTAPDAGWWRVAWLLPSLATTACTLGLATRIGVGRASFVVGTVWLVVVVVVGQATDDPLASFGAVGQAAMCVAGLAGAAVAFGSRRRLLRGMQ